MSFHTEAMLPPMEEVLGRGTLYGRVQGVRVSLLRFSYPLLRGPLSWPALGCSLLSLDDLACRKLSAIALRGTLKDFVDLYAIVRKHRQIAHEVPGAPTNAGG